MAAFEGSYKSQLQGVSQQIARERLDGQVSAQENMLSDAVTGLRRRPGAEWQNTFAVAGATRDNTIAWDSDVGGARVKFVLNFNTGVVRIYDQEWNLVTTMPAQTYLTGGTRQNYQSAVVGPDFFICNTSKQPALSGTQPGLSTGCGFFYVKTGAFEKTYTINVAHDGGAPATVNYTTPAASVAGAANLSSPEYIAGQLASSLNGIGFSCQQFGSYVTVFLAGGGGTQMQITTPLPSSYIGTSNMQSVLTEGDLPARLGTSGDTMIIAVGSTRTPTYYQFNYARQAWLECGKLGSPATITNMPVRLTNVGGTWSYGATYEGRLAGDDISNPNPSFISRGITGIGSFQGRLVILAGSRVCMSGSNNYARWYRSTVTNVIASDPIDVGASANSSAAYQYCVPFQKDLLLFSAKYQALVPGNAVAITPNNATVVITSTYESDMTCSPIPLGRTLMYSAPRSQDFFGILEMAPSQYTDSQYTSQDATAHLPKYLPGRCRFAVASSVANIAVFGSTSDYRQLIVHEYLWTGSDKTQQAWHRWTFPFDIADVFFSGSDINIIFANGAGVLMACTIDPRIGTLTAQAERRPFLDCYQLATATANSVPINTTLSTFDATAYQKLRLADTAPDLAGEEVGVLSRFSDHLVTVPSFEAGGVTIGYPYKSSVSPTPPMVKDANGVVISSNKLTILRFMVGTANSYEYEAIVTDASVEDNMDDEIDMATLYWGSSELDLGHPRINSESTAILPCRTNAATTTLVLSTDGLGEMNIIALEYVGRYNQKLRRR